MTNIFNKYKTKQLRITISAHDLQRLSTHDLKIEFGRYKHIPKQKRVGQWCKLTLNTFLLLTCGDWNWTYPCRFISVDVAFYG